jgi:hypothetical protein
MLMRTENREVFKAVHIKAACQRCTAHSGKWHWLKPADPQMVGGLNIDDYKLT